MTEADEKIAEYRRNHPMCSRCVYFDEYDSCQAFENFYCNAKKQPLVFSFGKCELYVADLEDLE